ncbi:aspartic proteinase CDR1-like [Cicer arietinum]|uniref:Aspartic proteinase CDR1-like n=1 Tax=Cicer arietinum TaxID=3827 RepID=A0A1S2XIW2_CICAR|nr:aspartic proteinase CDR1-like [Cicer arietinum]
MNALVFFILALYSVFSISIIEASKIESGFSIDLIHRDSAMSPYYNPSMSTLDLLRNADSRSSSRLKKFSLSMLSNENESPESFIIPNNGDFLIKIYIGTPPVERFAIVDTGSDLTWVQCSPCASCFHQDTPLYVSSKSSTFTNVPCHSQSCTLLPPNQHACGKSQQCLYSYFYGDKSFTVGELVFDSISFGSNVTIPKSMFGCGYYNNFTADTSGKPVGIVGLGAGPLSLISQLGDSIGRKFSYCLLPFNSKSASKLKFGNQAVIKGDSVVSTPLLMNSSQPFLYQLNLQGITIGQNTLQTGRTDGNIVIDSGTTLTFLEQPFFDNFLTSMKQTIGIESVQNVPKPFHYCFPSQPNFKFPSTILHFNGANITLTPLNLFSLVENYLLCLTVLPSHIQGFSILGNLAHVNFQVEYDLERKILSFAASDCTDLNLS